MWPEGFDPANLTRDASLNKLVVRPAPGAKPAHVGRRGGDLLGRDAVLRLIRQRCRVAVAPSAVSDWLGRSMATEGVTAVVDEVGDRLGMLRTAVASFDGSSRTRMIVSDRGLIPIFRSA